jgi:hypothetical protein
MKMMKLKNGERNSFFECHLWAQNHETFALQCYATQIMSNSKFKQTDVTSRSANQQQLYSATNNRMNTAHYHTPHPR